MGPGFKYHVVTIAAIFFALTVGLVFGSLFVSPRLVSQQARLLSHVQKSLDQDNRVLRDRVAEWEDFGKRISPLVLKERLAGVPVAVVYTGDYPDALTDAREALDLAGARIASVTDMAHGFEQPDAALTTNLAALHTADPRFPTDRTGLADALAGILVHGDSVTDGFLPALERENFIATEGAGDAVVPAKVVVIVAGSRAPNSLRPTYVDQPMIAALEKAGALVVMCEPRNAAASDTESYRALNISIPTIHNIDSDIGRTDLVLTLSGTK